MLQHLSGACSVIVSTHHVIDALKSSHDGSSSSGMLCCKSVILAQWFKKSVDIFLFYLF